MKIEFLPDKKLDAMLEQEFPEFPDDSPQAKRWDEIAGGLCGVLCRYAEDEESEEATGAPGFLSSDIFQGFECLNAEFNAERLLQRDALEAVSEFLDRQAPHYSFAFHFFGTDSKGLQSSMHSGIYRHGTLYLPAHKAARKTLQSAGWTF